MTRLAVLLVVLISTDQVTKAVLETPAWGWHQRDLPLSSFVFGFAALAVILAYPATRVAGCVLAAGSVGNLVSILHGPVANPFVYGDVAFNFADVCLYAGFALIPLSAPWVYRDMHKRWDNREETA